MKKTILALFSAAVAAFTSSALAQATINFQFLNDAGGAVPVYVGPGVPGFGTGTYWNVIPGPHFYQPGSYNSTNDLADDGTTHLGIVMRMAVFPPSSGNWSTNGPGSIPLLDSYLEVVLGDPPGTFSFTNVPSGTYDLVLFGANGVYRGNATKYTVNGESITAINNSDSAFVQDVNYVVFSNLMVTTGTITGTFEPGFTIPDSRGNLNGAQLKQVSLNSPAPTFSPNPPSVTHSSSVYAGATVTFATTVSGNVPMTRRWQVNKGSGFTNLTASATNSTLTLTNVQASDAGAYRLVATNSSGNAASQPVTLTVDTSKQAFTINFQWQSSEGGPVPHYTGPGVPGYGTGTFWNTVPGPDVWSPGVYSSTNSLADNGVTDKGITWTLVTAGSTSSTNFGPGSIYLLDSYADAFDANPQPFTFDNVTDGNYNLVLFGANGTYRGNNATTYIVNGVSQSLTNNFTDSAFIKNVTYVVFSNVAVTGGTLTGEWQAAGPGGHPEGNLNGAQLQLVGPIVNTVTLTIQSLAGGQVQLTWPQGTLQQSSVLGTGASWSAVGGATSPYPTPATGPAKYYRVLVSP